MKYLLIFFLIFNVAAIPAEDEISLKTNNAKSSMIILGTSTIHDWEMKAENLVGAMEVDFYESSVDIKELTLNVPVKSLKSGKSAMDNNAYEALKEEKHATIKYQYVKATSQKEISPGRLRIETEGKLTVAGVTKILKLPLEIYVNNGTVTIEGSVKLAMSSFNVEAPSFMMGTITTGDKITINFSLVYN